MAQDIKQKIVLEGEKEYNAALRDAQRHLKTLRSELKAETAELGKNATAQDKNKVKSENLQKSIKEQEKIVKTLKTALDQAKKEYGDNEEVVAKWETKLNEARATLANMKNDLDGLGDSLKEVNSMTAAGVTASRSFAEAIESIGNAGGTISSSIENTFMGVIDVVRDAVSDLWALVADTAAKANEWTDIAAIWNTDPAKIERYARGVEYAGKSFSDLQSAVSKIATGDAEKIQKLTGVSWVGDVDEWQYAMDVLSSISGMEYQQKLEALSEIFGDKRAAGVMDIVNAWGTILEGGDKLTSGGYGIGEGALGTMNEIQERINNITASWEALKANIATKLGQATLPILMDVQGGLDGIAEYLNAKDDDGRAKAMEKITANITQFCKDVAAVIKAGLEIIGQVGEDLQGSDSVIEQVIGSALLTLKKTLEWLMDDKNWQTIKTALEAFFGLWLVGKGAAALSAVAALAANIKTISAFGTLKNLTNLFGGGGGGSAATEAAAGAAGKAAAGAAGGTGGGSLLTTILGSAAAKIGTGLLAGGAVLFKNAFTEQGNADVMTGEEESEYRRTHLETGFQQLYTAIMKTPGNVEGLREEILERLFPGTEMLDDDTRMYFSDAIIRAAEEYWDAFRENPFGAGPEVDSAYNSLAGLFGPDMEDDFNRLMGLIEDLWTQKEDYPDLPSWWFDNGSGGEGSDAETLSGLKGLPGQISAAARAGTAQGISGIRVYMDGTAVGHLVAPTVSRDIASWTV